MTGTPRKALLAASIFGICDGMMSILGVALDLRGHPEVVLRAALLGAVSAGLSMAVAQHLSEDNDSTLPAAIAIGISTAAGTALPALPCALLHGAAAIGGTGAVCGLLAVAVALLRGHGDARRILLALVLLASVFAVTVACTLLTPGGA